MSLALGEGRGRSPAKGKVETTKTSGARAVEITRVCRLVDNNVLAAPILYGSSSKHPPAQPLSSTEEDPGRALGVEVAEYTCTGVIAARWAAVSLGRVQILAAVHGVRVPDEARVWVSVCLSHARGVPSPVLG